ncbi:MAG TPA: hypothetical protein VFD84_03335 [Candidatus Binatia bacterium]|nr:hypothetical protein [Candidatus Binatia bacterium]
MKKLLDEPRREIADDSPSSTGLSRHHFAFSAAPSAIARCARTSWSASFAAFSYDSESVRQWFGKPSFDER